MKIKRIQVKNIGPYVNENAFDFDVSDITKRMVLIGGKNGAGKTTLFNAIKICLYGCVASGAHYAWIKTTQKRKQLLWTS